METTLSAVSKQPYPRFRSSGGFTAPKTVYQSYSSSGTVYDSFGVGTKEWMSDIVTPGFKKLSAEGKVLMSPMTMVRQTKLCENLSLAAGRYYGNPSYWWGYTEGPRTIWTQGLGINDSLFPTDVTLHSTDDLRRLRVEASTQCLSNIGRASTDSWENLAEVDKTLGMFWSPLKSWFRFERKARAASLALSTANAWLMYRYGIKPLVSSVMDIHKALNRELRPVRETNRGQVTSSTNQDSTPTYSNSGYSWTLRKSITETVNVRAVSVDDVVMDWFYDRGLSAKSILTLPWELVPYSFVADWFVNFGDYIGALANCIQPKSYGRCLTTTIVRSGVQYNQSCTASPSWEGMTNPHLDLVREDALWRQRVVGLETPGIVVKSDFRLDKATRIGDSFALVGQQILRRFIRRS